MSAKTFKWTVEIEVSENMVADGINLSENDAIQRALWRACPYAFTNEITAQVIKAPSPESIAIVQGAYRRLGWVRHAGLRDRYHVLARVGQIHLRYLCDADPEFVGPRGEGSVPEIYPLDVPKSKQCPECKRRDES